MTVKLTSGFSFYTRVKEHLPRSLTISLINSVNLLMPQLTNIEYPHHLSVYVSEV
jgi:hypothetical protein